MNHFRPAYECQLSGWWDRSSPQFETVYVILLNIHKRLQKQIYFVRPEGKKKDLLHSLALALTLIFNHLANELLQATTTLYGLMYLTYGSMLNTYGI